MKAEFGTQVDVGKGTVGSNLDKVVAQCTKWRDKIQVIGFEVVKFGDVHQEVTLYVFVLWGPDLFFLLVDDSVLVQMVISGGTWWGSEEVQKKVCFREDGETEGTTRRSRWDRGRDYSDRGDNDGQQEVFYRDVRKWNLLDYFLKLLVDICVLGLGVGIFKLRTREVVLLGSNVSENFEEVGQGSDKDK